MSCVAHTSVHEKIKEKNTGYKNSNMSCPGIVLLIDEKK